MLNHCQGHDSKKSCLTNTKTSCFQAAFSIKTNSKNDLAPCDLIIQMGPFHIYGLNHWTMFNSLKIYRACQLQNELHLVTVILGKASLIIQHQQFDLDL